MVELCAKMYSRSIIMFVTNESYLSVKEAVDFVGKWCISAKLVLHLYVFHEYFPL